MKLRRCWPMALLACGACSWVGEPPTAKPVPAYFAGDADVDAVRRIMVLPFQRLPGVTAESELIRDAFLTELGKVQRFEIVPLPPHGADEQDAIQNGLLRGRVEAAALASLGERYRIDGVLLGTVTGYRPYKPPHLGLRVQLVSLHAGEAVWATEAYYDATDAATVRDLEHYAQSYLAPSEDLHGWELMLISPARFAGFVAHRMVATWRR